MTAIQPKTFPCAGCGGGLAFDPATQGLLCPQCGSRTPLTIQPRSLLEFDLEAALAAGKGKPAEAGARRLRCPGCSAELRFSEGLEASACPFCGMGVVMEDRPGDPVLAPDGILAFRVDRAQARALFHRWLSRRWFAPSDLRRRGESEILKGVYVPFWTYDASADSEWTALSGTYYYTTETYRDSRGQIRTRQVRHIRWWPSSGRHAGAYDDVPVCASLGIPADLLAGIEPFALKAAVPCDSRLMAGWQAESYGRSLQEGWKEAAERVRAWEAGECDALVPGDTHMNLEVRTALSDLEYKQILLPVWVAAYRYREKTYRFLINGETGKLEGESPWSWWKVSAAILLGAAVLLGALWLNSR